MYQPMLWCADSALFSVCFVCSDFDYPRPRVSSQAYSCSPPLCLVHSRNPWTSIVHDRFVGFSPLHIACRGRHIIKNTTMKIWKLVVTHSSPMLNTPTFSYIGSQFKFMAFRSRIMCSHSSSPDWNLLFRSFLSTFPQIICLTCILLLPPLVGAAPPPATPTALWQLRSRTA